MSITASIRAHTFWFSYAAQTRKGTLDIVRLRQVARVIHTVFWLVIYWLAAAIGILVLAIAATILSSDNDSGVHFMTISLVVGSLALVAGAIMATTLRPWRMAPAPFLRATSAIRINAVAWIGSISIAVTFGVTFRDEFPTTGTFVDSVVTSAPEAITAILGFGAGLLLVGAGISDYAEGLAATGAPSSTSGSSDS